jgi:peroxiredoxin
MIILNIKGHTVEKIEDPFGLLSGERFEFFLELEVDEEDELYSEKGVGIRVLYIIDEKGHRISNYHLYESETEKVLDFALEDDEEEMVYNYCKENIGN